MAPVIATAGRLALVEFAPDQQSASRAAAENTEAAERAHCENVSAPNSTAAYAHQLRLAGDAFGIGGFDVLADRLEGIAPRPGPAGIDDTAALNRIEAFERTGKCSNAVMLVARLMFPGDPRKQEASAHRWRRRRKEKRTS